LCGAFARAEGHDATDGKKDQSTEAQADVSRSDGPCEFSHQYGQQKCEPERDATVGAAEFRCRVHGGTDQKKGEGHMHPHVNGEEPA
jgi:hypothetical protein